MVSVLKIEVLCPKSLVLSNIRLHYAHFAFISLCLQVGGTGTVFAVATKYSPSRDVTFRAKLNNESQFGAAVQHTLSNSLILNLSTQMNLASNEGHKFGLGLEFTPSN